MRFLSDKSLGKLRSAGSAPDLSGTRYELVRFVARGGMGSVYVATDRLLRRRVALKVLEHENPNDDLSARLLHESRVLAQLEHPGIVPIHDAGTLADGRAFYVMKFVEGFRLDQFIAGVASLPDRLRLFLRVCDAVSFAHSRGVLHRDLKPANIMVGAFGEVLVMDWGLAKLLAELVSLSAAAADSETLITDKLPASSEITESTAITGEGLILGTPGYMSPEQARGDSSTLDARSDIFSLGKLLQFIAENPSAVSHTSLPRPLRAICERAFAENSADRYSSVADFASDLVRFLDGQQVSAYRENLFERTYRFYQRYQAAILLITAYLVMRALFILFPRH